MERISEHNRIALGKSEAPKKGKKKAVKAEPETAEQESDKVDGDAEEKDSGLSTILVLEDVPPFVGTDRTYELHKEDIVSIPDNFAKVLVSRGVAKVLDTNK